ncbi:MAG: DegT/DnrJ/EryC1/StrS family aminotransferase [Saprospiraceae bacterium]
MIPITKPFLPPLGDYQKYMEGIWQRNWLTNNGPLVNELELKIKEYLNLKHLLFLSNGTIAIQIAIKALDLNGEIITSPFSYIATTSSIVWENCTPVFVDIDAETLNIDPSLIEAAITEKTSAILATHVYGNPCDIIAIENIAKKNNLKVIYDAAHCFGSKYDGISVFAFGDIATTSFHATKLFHTIEGGAVISNEAELIKKMSFLRNFGHDGPETFASVGINGKNSEFHAAMGIANLKYITEILESRKEQSKHYDLRLQPLKIKRVKINSRAEFNNAYYPIIFESEENLLKAVENLNAHRIYPRRYFTPSLNKLPFVKYQSTPISEDISTRVLCLPLYHGLTFEEINFICRILIRSQNY